MNTKPPESWASDPNARGVRIELTSERSILLPFDQFAYAELETEKKEQRLRLVFATHEVTLRGYSLRRIETAMQRMELSLLASIPNSHRPAMAEHAPLILEIVVTEAISPEGQPEQPKPTCTIPQKS